MEFAGLVIIASTLIFVGVGVSSVYEVLQEIRDELKKFNRARKKTREREKDEKSDS